MFAWNAHGGNLNVASDAVPAESPSGDGSQDRLHLTVLGPFSASVGGRPVRLPTRKAQALLSYLALGDVAGESRERMMALLWSESDSRRAGYSLRQAIKEVNDALLESGFTGFNPGKQTLTLDRSLVVNDVDAVMHGAAATQVHPRLLDTQRLADTLLIGLEAVDPAFQVWVRARRHVLHERLTMTLENALPTDPATGNGAETAQALLNLDPTHEVGCRHLMRVRVARGQIGAALQTYKALWDVLDEEYDVEPSKETQELVVQIKQQTGWSTRPGDAMDPRLAGGVVSVPAPAVAPRPQRLLIAVNPFDLSGLPDELRPTLNGFRHELTASLARFREWSIRTPAPGGKAAAAPDAASAEYAFDATAYGSGDGMRLVATLTDGDTNVVWSDQFTVVSTDLLASLQSIVRAIAIALKVNLSADRQRRMSARADLSGALYDTWLRGQDYVLRFSADDWQTGQDLFQKVAAEAPDFSPVISSLVQLGNTRHIVFPGIFRSNKEHADALRLAQRAVLLDPQDSRAQLCVAWAHQLTGRTTEALLHAEMAVDLNPNDSWTLMAAAQMHAYCGDYGKAVPLCNASMAQRSLQTAAHRAYATAILFLAGRYRESVDVSGDGIEPAPSFAIWRAASLVQLGEMTRARDLLARAVGEIRGRWNGSISADDRTIYRWLLHMFPIAVEGDWQRLRRSLAKAGAVVDQERFGIW